MNINHQSRSFVGLLFFFRSPLAVVRIVAEVVVDTIYRVLGTRGSSHVQQEVFKRILPSRTDSYASTAVPRIVFAPRIAATSPHGFPCNVFFGQPTPAGITVLYYTLSVVSAFLRRYFTPKTSARCSASSSQIGPENVNLTPARTLAPPNYLGAGTGPGAIQNGEASKGHSAHVSQKYTPYFSSNMRNRLASVLLAISCLSLASCQTTQLAKAAKTIGQAQARVVLPPYPDDCRVTEIHAALRKGDEVLAILARERRLLDRQNARTVRCAGFYDGLSREIK